MLHGEHIQNAIDSLTLKHSFISIIHMYCRKSNTLFSITHTHVVRWAGDLGGPAAKLSSLIDAWIPAGDLQSSSTFFRSTLSFLIFFFSCVFVGEVTEGKMENKFPLHSRRDLRSGKGGRRDSFKLLVDLVQKWEWNGEDSFCLLFCE